MKLYATTTSERASKGQGGNKFIRIELNSGSAKDSMLEYLIEFTPEWLLVRDGDGNVLLRTGETTEKGNKQKGGTSIEDLDRDAETRRDIDSMA